MRSQNSRRLVIHAGMHKTASTTLQVALNKNRQALSDAGVIYPPPAQGHAHHSLVAYWNPQLRTTYPPRNSFEGDWQDINDLAVSSAKTVILSSEEFSRRAPFPVDFEEVLRKTSSFDSHEIVVVLRDQVSLLQSVFLQIRHGNRMSKFSEWLCSAPEDDHNPGLFFDYSRLHEHLRKAFSPEQISYLPYDTINDHQLGIMGRFLAHLGFADVPGLKAVDRRNVSIDALGYYLGRELLGDQLPSKPQSDLVTSCLLERHPDKKSTTLFTKAEAESLAERFTALNKAFETVAGPSLRAPIPMAQIERSTLYRCEVTEDDRRSIQRSLSQRAV